MSSYGNYVLIDHGDGELSLVAHLHQGSVRVKPGDHVRTGDVVAEAGNSGSSLGPHVHYELRTGWGVRGIHSLPPYFHDLTLVPTGERAGTAGIPINTGDVVIAK
jgi:murein DD-endopeptidase MepM/ murein hydrolase activator NlpD